MYQPKTGEPCSCKRGIQRDNCPACEGTGMRIDFAAIRRRTARAEVFRAARQAILDEEEGRGGFYSGTATPTYLAVKAALNLPQEKE